MRALLAGLLLCVACNTHVYSPPTGTFPVEGPATVGAQRRSVGADLSYEGAVFGPELFTGRLTYRHGLTDQMEVSAAPSVIFIPGSRAGDSHGGIYAGRAAFKYAPIRHVSGSLGFGGGGSAAGSS
jgi:hypothetical protein